jgi:predicted outer membrane repeat protein
MHVAARRVALALAAVLLLTAPAHADFFRVGVGSGCTHATVQAAVDAAALTSETDTILVARNTTYSGQAITIHNQSLNIFGGHADCNTLAHSGRTVLSGSGGAAAPVVSVTGSGDVTMWRLDLTRGDSPDDAHGGGLYFNGSGVMRLEDLNVIDNRAGYGGGIHARGTSATAELVIGADVLVSNNTADRSGGGINADTIRLTMTSPRSAVFFNTAVGLDVAGELIFGDGGGIRCFQCQARIGTASPLGTIFLNTASNRGGGLAVFAGGKDVSLDLFTGVATAPLSIWGNRAGAHGGGIYAQSNHEGLSSFHNAYIWAWDLVLRGNTAPQGAAVYLRGHDDFNGASSTWFSLGAGGRPAGAVECAAALRPCNRIYENEARSLDATPANGAILQGGTERVRFELVHTLLYDNVGRSVLRHGTSQWTMLRGCVLTGNTVSEELVQHLDSFYMLVDDTTIAGNTIGGSHVFVAGRDVWMGHSIVWQPGKKVLRRGSSGGDLLLRSLIVNDIAELPPQVDVVAPPNGPGFASLVERDFRLQASSAAVDFAQYAPEFEPWVLPTDLAGSPREVDLPEIPNEFGPRDVGAYELPVYPDLIFKDGFDLGGLAGWSAAQTDGGDLAPAAGAAMVGTLGIQATVDDTTGLYVQDESPNDEPRYRARFYLDPNGFDPGEALTHRRSRVLIGFTEGPLRRVFAVVLRRVNGAYAVMARARLDEGTQVDTGFVPITDAPHVIEVDLRSATGPDTGDGWIQLWVDGVPSGSVSGLGNHRAAVDLVRLGALSVKGGSSGALRFDAFESRRRTYIGPVP